MTWREEAKELGIPMWQRSKVDVMRDIELKKLDMLEPQPAKVTIDIKDATKICSDALFNYAKEQGLSNITCERWGLNCKRKGIVFRGMKNVRRQEEESEGIGPDVSSSIRDAEREDSPEGAEEASQQRELSCSVG